MTTEKEWQELLGRALADEAFRAQLFDDPRQAAQDAGYDLTEEQLAALKLEHATLIGASVITAVTATSIVFEIVGPILTKIALQRAGEITVQEGGSTAGGAGPEAP